MKANVFLVDPRLGLEDQLTAFWHYVLNVVPGLGQAFVDDVAARSGVASSRFVGAIDHPVGDRQNHPDLLVQCRDFEVLFEHKVDSPLGLRQIHRYLDLAAKRKWRLALLAARRLELDTAVRESHMFLRPQGSSAPPHFLWQDVHGLLAASSHHLAQEFKEYLEILGLGHFSWASVGNPFVDESAAKELRSLYDALRPLFAAPGVSCRLSASSLLYQIRKPFPPVHLVNIGPLESVAQWDRRLRGPVMALWAWVRRKGAIDRRVLPRASDAIPRSSPRIFIDNNDDPNAVPYDRNVFVERYYYVPLEEVLTQSKELSQARLAYFARTAMKHLRDLGVVADHGA